MGLARYSLSPVTGGPFPGGALAETKGGERRAGMLHMVRGLRRCVHGYPPSGSISSGDPALIRRPGVPGQQLRNPSQ